MIQDQIRVLIVEDHQVVADGLSALLNDQPDLQADLLLAGNLLVRWLRDGTDLGTPFSLLEEGQ